MYCKYKSFYDGDPKWYGYKTEIYWRNLQFPIQLAAKPWIEKNNLWVLISCEYALFGMRFMCEMAPYTASEMATYGVAGPGIYDPTNGTMSTGDIVRIGP